MNPYCLAKFYHDLIDCYLPKYNFPRNKKNYKFFLSNLSPAERLISRKNENMQAVQKSEPQLSQIPKPNVDKARCCNVIPRK